jgi:hypothetical protein
MHLHCYIIVLAEYAEDAISEVRCWIDDYSGRDFFDYGSVLNGENEDEENYVLLSSVREQLEKDKAETFEKTLPYIMGNIEKCKIGKNRHMEGYWHIYYGRVLAEYPCCDMPFYNLKNEDWSIPTELPKDALEGYEWYAVRVDLHY